MATEKSLSDDQLNSAIHNFADLVKEDLSAISLTTQTNTVVDIYRDIEAHIKTMGKIVEEQIIRAIAKHDFNAMAKNNYYSFIRNRIEEDEQNGETRSV